MDCDVLIIGAGVTGCAIARELSRYQLDVVVAERGSDVAVGASRANSAIIHAGYDCVPGTLMARLNVAGNQMMEGLCEELSVEYKPTGSLVIALGEAQKDHLGLLLRQGEQSGVPGLRILTAEEAFRMEPALNPAVTQALWAPTAGIVEPFDLTLALAQNAVENGATVLTEWEAVSIAVGQDGLTVTSRSGERIRARYLINAAGVHADAVSAMAGGMAFRIIPRRGEYMVLDRTEGDMVRTVIFQTPSEMGKGVLVTPSVHGNLIIGPTAQDIDDGDDTATTARGLEEVRRTAPLSVPGLRLGQVIRTFSGIRAVLDGRHDFLIEADPGAPGLIHAAGICSPGLSSAPAIALEVAGILKEQGLALEPKKTFNTRRNKPKPFQLMSDGERRAAIGENPLYGNVICRCETVTEAEIVASIHGPVPAATLDAVKWRTRAGMGRCQSGFCAPRVMEILAREQGVTLDRVTKFGGGSWLVRPKTRAKEDNHE